MDEYIAEPSGSEEKRDFSSTIPLGQYASEQEFGHLSFSLPILGLVGFYPFRRGLYKSRHSYFTKKTYHLKGSYSHSKVELPKHEWTPS